MADNEACIDYAGETMAAAARDDAGGWWMPGDEHCDDPTIAPAVKAIIERAIGEIQARQNNPLVAMLERMERKVDQAIQTASRNAAWIETHGVQAERIDKLIETVATLKAQVDTLLEGRSLIRTLLDDPFVRRCFGVAVVVAVVAVAGITFKWGDLSVDAHDNAKHDDDVSLPVIIEP